MVERGPPNRAPCKPRPHERRWTLTKNGKRIDAELMFHGEYGVKIQFLHEGVMAYGRRWTLREQAVQGAWTKAREAATLGNFQLRDLRHEAASRFDEAGMPIVFVSSFLGHSNLSTTSRYLNINRRGMHIAMENMDDSRAKKPKPEEKDEAKSGTNDSVAQALHTTDPLALAVVSTAPSTVLSKTTVQ